MFLSDDTIVAIATPAGRAGIGVVRLSGPDAVAVATTLIRPATLAPRHATLVKLIDPADGAIVDHAVATWFMAPHSYTGEDVVEISAHGSPVLLQRIVELAVSAGARIAQPGEFTLRAYLRGRLDLAQAEAVADVIDAVTPLQARAAMDQLEGTLTGAIARIDAALFDLSARLEASLDYPDEGFHFASMPDTAAAMSTITTELARLARDGRAGRVIREGRSVAIIGRPNAGKSSLFNALVGASRAIVTDIPGTTRDLLTERVDINGLAITLVDTAGIREARDAIEAEGVKRARDAQRVAALKLIVIDGSTPLTNDDRGFVAASAVPGLVVVSKADLPRAWSPEELGLGDPDATAVSAINSDVIAVSAVNSDVIAVSAITGEGLAELRRRVFVALTAREDLRDPPAVTNVRHVALVEAALEAMSRAEAALAGGATEELVLTDVTAARRALEEITGRRTTDDLLTHIFSRFCLGK